jgi:uncharacterized protein
MSMIFETVVTTCSPQGEPHIAPMGVRYEGDTVVLMPFRPSATLDNILATECAVLNIVDDVRVFAGCVTGRRQWPLVDVQHAPRALRLEVALEHVCLRLVRHQEDAQRPVLHLQRAGGAVHRGFIGFNRAQAAVIEGAVLVSRLHMLPKEKVDEEMSYLQIAIDKTAGEPEREAWGWLREAVQRQRETPAAATRGASS